MTQNPKGSSPHNQSWYPGLFFQRRYPSDLLSRKKFVLGSHVNWQNITSSAFSESSWNPSEFPSQINRWSSRVLMGVIEEPRSYFDNDPFINRSISPTQLQMLLQILINDFPEIQMIGLWKSCYESSWRQSASAAAWTRSISPSCWFHFSLSWGELSISCLSAGVVHFSEKFHYFLIN